MRGRCDPVRGVRRGALVRRDRRVPVRRGEVRPLELHIRRRKSAPDRCPVCGLSSRAPKDDSFKEIMGYYLTSQIGRAHV